MANSAITFNTAGLASATSPGLVGTGAQTFAGAKTFNNGLVFAASSLSDAQATLMGLKQYLHGTAYNSGISPTVTSAQAGFSVIRSVFVPYQTQDGAWRLRFNIAASFTASIISVVSVSINGVVSKNLTQYFQPVFGVFYTVSGTNGFYQSYAGVNNGTLTCQLTSTNNVNGVAFSGDIELDSKPTWAY